MVIYEVNITINNEIYSEYYNWLVEHAKEMLTIEGFISAEILEQTDGDAKDKTVFTTLYKLNSMEDVQNYLQNHASRMRDLGMNAFPNQFTANRRVFAVKETFTAKKSSCCCN